MPKHLLIILSGLILAQLVDGLLFHTTKHNIEATNGHQLQLERDTNSQSQAVCLYKCMNKLVNSLEQLVAWFDSLTGACKCFRTLTEKLNDFQMAPKSHFKTFLYHRQFPCLFGQPCQVQFTVSST